MHAFVFEIRISRDFFPLLSEDLQRLTYRREITVIFVYKVSYYAEMLT